MIECRDFISPLGRHWYLLPTSLVQRAIHMRPLYSLDRLLDGDRSYSKMSDKRAIVRENDKERRRYSNGIDAQSGDL